MLDASLVTSALIQVIKYVEYESSSLDAIQRVPE